MVVWIVAWPIHFCTTGSDTPLCIKREQQVCLKLWNTASSSAGSLAHAFHARILRETELELSVGGNSGFQSFTSARRRRMISRAVGVKGTDRGVSPFVTHVDSLPVDGLKSRGVMPTFCAALARS